jgi:hypothetical protein
MQKRAHCIGDEARQCVEFGPYAARLYNAGPFAF